MTATDHDERNTRQNTEVRALRMLRAGDSHSDVSKATGLTREAVARLQRDFPGPAPVPHRLGTATPLQIGAPAKAPVHLATQPGPAVDLSAHDTPAFGPKTIARLLEEATGHSSKTIRNLAERIEGQLDLLRAKIDEQAEAEKQRQDAAAAKARAKAEIERLEQQLAAAKAKLRGKPTSTPTSAAAQTGRARTPCSKGCGRLLTGQGRRRHEDTCSGS